MIENSDSAPPIFSKALLSALYWGVTRGILAAAIWWLLILSYSGGKSGLFLSQVVILAAVLIVVFSLARLIWQSRTLLDRSFTVFGFAATFFGFAILVVFFVSLVIDTAYWFHYTPQFVAAANVEYERKAAEAEKTYIERELAKIEEKRHQAIERSIKDHAKLLGQSVGGYVGGAAIMSTIAPGSGPLSSAMAALGNRAALLGKEKMIAEIDEIRRIYDEQIRPRRIRELPITAKEIRAEAIAGIRPSQSSWAIFAYFFTHGSSHHAQDAGIWNALLGSLWVAVISMVCAVPIGVGAALYLEEYRTSSRLGNIIQVNINNLAGVPSVVYGILGGFVFVDMIFGPLSQINSSIAQRNVLGGGLTLGLLTLPMVIVASQESIRAVPKSIREGAYALGATQWQVTWRQVLPMASPGIFTGTILSVSRAIGEAAPLVLFGALIYVDQNPALFSRFTVLPMQIFAWAEQPAERLPNGESVDIWRYNAAVASLVLLFVLLSLNAVAIVLRNRAQRKRRA